MLPEYISVKLCKMQRNVQGQRSLGTWEQQREEGRDQDTWGDEMVCTLAAVAASQV